MYTYFCIYYSYSTDNAYYQNRERAFIGLEKWAVLLNLLCIKLRNLVLNFSRRVSNFPLLHWLRSSEKAYFCRVRTDSLYVVCIISTFFVSTTPLSVQNADNKVSHALYKDHRNILIRNRWRRYGINAGFHVIFVKNHRRFSSRSMSDFNSIGIHGFITRFVAPWLGQRKVGCQKSTEQKQSSTDRGQCSGGRPSRFLSSAGPYTLTETGALQMRSWLQRPPCFNYTSGGAKPGEGLSSGSWLQHIN